MPRPRSKKSGAAEAKPAATVVRPPDQANRNDVRTLIETLPQPLGARLLNHPGIDNLVEIVMDLGRKPQANFGDRRDEIKMSTVAAQDLQHVVSRVDEFGEDNRAGIEGTLHRVSCIRNRRGTVIGLTLRVGKPVKGPANLLTDILKERKSVLFLGAPGIGKSTVIRDVARVMSDEMNRRVVIVDTSNEIGGYGNIPHPFIGGARRMQVPNVDKQYNVMIEAVQNHRPEVVIVDEVGRREEVDACRSIGERGVQIIATVHGHTLENLVKNPQLVGLIGGIQTVTVGDVTAIKRAGDFDVMKKTVREREGPSAFDVLVEMRSRDEWYIHDVETSVDQVIKGQEMRVQVRSRHSITGAIQERTVMYSPSIVSPTGDTSAKTSVQEDVAKNGPRKIHVKINEHSKYFKAAVVGHKSDEWSDTVDDVAMKDLHMATLKTTRKEMSSILSNLSELDEDTNLEPNEVLFVGGLELWLRRVADAHGMNLSQSQYECASRRLASHAVQYLEQGISNLQPTSSWCEESEEDYPEPEYEDTELEELEEGLRPLLLELMNDQKPYWSYLPEEYPENDLFDRMSVHLKKVQDYPEDIGTIQSKFNIKTDAQDEVYSYLRKIVAYAGKGVKGVSGDEVKGQALHLTGVANGLAGQVVQDWARSLTEFL